MSEQTRSKQIAFAVHEWRRWLPRLGGPLLVGCLAMLIGCAGDEAATPVATRPIATVPVPTVTPRQLPSLVPTFTPVPSPTPLSVTPGAEPEATDERPSPTPASFDEVIVSLRYRIPTLDLDRRLVGNMASRITLLDATSGQRIELNNQGGVMLELRQALSMAELAERPDGCDGCVTLEFELSLEEQEASGWLQEEVLLASVENYMAAGLGPHFPPGTVVGLRRSASPYAPAHTVALLGQGELWAWLATDVEVSDPAATVTETVPLQAALDALDLEGVADNYVIDCAGSPIETLFIDRDGDETSTVIVCPEFSLPSTLLPLYLALDDLVEPVVVDARLPRPPAAFPLNALLDYKRGDGARLTLYHDGRAIALDTEATPYTSTLTSTQVVSLTAGLLQSGELARGLTTFEVRPTATITPGVPVTVPVPLTTSTLVLRGPEGLVEGAWEDAFGIEALSELNRLLNELVGLPEPTPEGTPEPTSTGGSETVDITPSPVSTVAAMPTP